MDTALPPLPYKFLDSYDFGDRGIFFGRKRETHVLLSDVVVQRLVVLFAGTGTGKTSLIKAGVQPLLADRGYETFFVRVRKDPTESARLALLAHEVLKSGLEGVSLADQLEFASQKLQKPIVLFFDQFEEFFIYVYHDKSQKDKARQFILDLAQVYRNRKSGVHFVFSMREEFFVEMEAFRDEIPAIFHNDSNLRLLWFDEAQARDAIVKPASAFGVEIEKKLEDQIVTDLSRDQRAEGLIEPAQLQIICDTLWRVKTSNRISLRDYESLGQEGAEGTVAEQILDRRLEEELEKIDTEKRLNLLYDLLPELQTDRKTKYVRDFKGLVTALNTDESSLKELLDRLEALRIIHISQRDDLVVVELSHDYLVKRLDYFRAKVKAIWPRRILNNAMTAYRERGDILSQEQLEKISQNVGVLTFNRDQATFLFRSALMQGIEMRMWFDQASKLDKEMVWGILKDRINHGEIDEASNVIRLLGDLQSPRAIEILEGVFRETELAQDAIGTLGHIESTPAVEFLGRALNREAFAPYARDALLRLARSKKTDVAVSAENLLIPFLRKALSQRDQAISAINSLMHLQTVSSVKLLATLLSQDQFADSAQKALNILETATSDEVANLASKALASISEIRKTRSATLRKTETGQVPSEVSRRYTPSSSATSSALPAPLIRSRLESGKVIPFLGFEVSLGGRDPRKQEWNRTDTLYLPTNTELANYLAKPVKYPSDDSKELTQVAKYFEILAGRDPLDEELRRVFDRDVPYSETHRFLASNPTPLLIITTNYDDLMERALAEQNREFDVVTQLTRSTLRRATHNERADSLLWRPFKSEPRFATDDDLAEIDMTRTFVVFKIYGSIDREHPERDSYVITEDDHIDLLTRISGQNMGAIPSIVARYIAQRPLLFLGYGLRDWNHRILLNQIDRGSRRSFISWAVQFNPSPLEEQYWSKRGIEVFNLKVEQFVEELQKG